MKADDVYAILSAKIKSSIKNPIQVKGRVNSVTDLPNSATPGDLYFVGYADATEFNEYIFTTDRRWEKLGVTDSEIPKFRDLTLEQYNNLTESEKNNGTYYNIIEE